MSKLTKLPVDALLNRWGIAHARQRGQNCRVVIGQRTANDPALQRIWNRQHNV